MYSTFAFESHCHAEKEEKLWKAAGFQQEREKFGFAPLWFHMN
jgi:hypothetical protein